MREDSIEIEERRLKGISEIQDYPWFKERHRVFPAVFENRAHQKIIDLSAGVGCAAFRIKSQYGGDIVCNEITPKCLQILTKIGLKTVSFNIDDPKTCFPFPDSSFDAAVSLVTIEHLLNPEHFLRETKRILSPGGFLYISAPNYAAPEYAVKLILTGRSFHNPLGTEEERYEFFGHVRYYTYKTLLEYVKSFGFVLDTVYIAMPGGSARYKDLYARSKWKALFVRNIMRLRHLILSPRWASEPILCLRSGIDRAERKARKVVL